MRIIIKNIKKYQLHNGYENITKNNKLLMSELISNKENINK